MRELLPDLARWKRRGERVVLATVVATRRSAPRPVGSKLAVSEGGELAGSVSGGCVENEVYAHARELLAGGPPRLLTYGISDDQALEVGLPCGGELDVFVAEPDPDLLERLTAAVEANEEATSVTIVEGDPLAAQVLVTPDGSTAGDRALERLARARRQRAGRPARGRRTDGVLRVLWAAGPPRRDRRRRRRGGALQGSARARLANGGRRPAREARDTRARAERRRAPRRLAGGGACADRSRPRHGRRHSDARGAVRRARPDVGARERGLLHRRARLAPNAGATTGAAAREGRGPVRPRPSLRPLRPRRRGRDACRDGGLDPGRDPRRPCRARRRPASLRLRAHPRRSGLIASVDVAAARSRAQARAEKLADLLVTYGANVRPGQIVELASDVGKEELTRIVARRAYEAGAKFVDVSYFDLHVKRARLELAPAESLDFVPPWFGQKVLALGDHRAAALLLTGPAAPHLLDDIDPARVGRDRLPSVPEYVRVINDRTINWSLAPCPTAAWAKLVFPDLDEAAALERLWQLVERTLRLDEPDPVAAWNERMDVLERVASGLTERRFDALHFQGPGTDLTVGLLPSSRWMTARAETVDGISHVVNLPSEETFTAPDPARVDGIARATMPLELSGLIVEGLRVRFESGRAVEIDAETGADAVRTLTQHDAGAARLGEVALVDREGRVGPLGTVFYDTLIDENAASHVALGNAYAISVEDEADRARANDSKIHVDFMIGGPNVGVTGLTGSGERVALLRDGAWQL